MKLKTVLHLILILDILILAGAAAGQAAAPISAFTPEQIIAEYNSDENIEKNFSENKHLQIKYIFTIVEIAKETQGNMRLNELFFNKSNKGNIYFYNREQILEFLDPVSLNNIKIGYEKENNLSYSIIKPEIIVSHSERASIEVNEEILNITEEDELFRSKNKLYLSLITSNISRDQQIITTDLIIETKENSFLETKVNTINGKESLLGILVIKNNNNINFVPEKNKIYVVYLRTIFLDKISKNDNQIINLDGLNNIISSSIWENKRNNEKYITVFIGKNNSLQSKLEFKNDFSFYLEFEENHYLMLGLDKTIFSKLNLELNIYTWNEIDYYFSLGVNEEVKISQYLFLSAGIYPIVYEINNEKFEDQYYWLKAKIFIFNDKNKISLYYKQRSDKENIRLEISREFWDRMEVILANKINLKEKGDWEIGLKWNF